MSAMDACQLLPACSFALPDDLSQHPLLVLYQQHTAADSIFNLSEHVAALSAASQLQLLAAVDECLLDLLSRQQHTAAATSESQHTAALSLLDCIVVLLRACLPASPDKTAASLSEPLLSSLQQLHDALLTFQHATAAQTQHRIATLLTAAYTAQPSLLLSLLPYLLPYLLLKCLEPSVRRSDVLALHSLRGAFAHFDYADDTSASLVQLLARAAVHPPLLRAREGRQLLATVWAASGVVGEAMHGAVREQCATGRRSLLEHYGDVYYRVWRDSGEGGEARRQCEGWLQQLMHLCLHCSLPRTHQALLQLLHVTHSHRKQRDVELMLARLYEPLLFRALSAAHPLLRLHALSVLVDVFPLASLDAEVPQEAHIAAQVQALLSALADAYAPSRAVAVRGLCLVLSLYWELLSAEVKVDTVTAVLALREDMAVPSRVAVCDGVRTLLSCHLSHQLLQPLLPQLAPLLHDRSEAVQSAFLSLLLAVKALRDIRYYHIAPLSALLLCLQHAAGSDKLTAKLRQLLSNSFWPDGGSSALLVRRLMVMLGENAIAARVFYGGSGSDARQDDIVRLAAGLVQLLTVSAQTVDKENAQPVDGAHHNRRVRQPKAKKSKAAAAKGDDVAAALPPIDPSDTPLVETLVAILASLWSQLHHATLQSADDEHTEYRRLVDGLAAAYGQLLNAYGGLSVCVRSALLSMLPQLPAEATGSAAASLPALTALPSHAGVGAYGPLLDCLVQWGKAPQLLLLITRAVRAATQSDYWPSTAAQRQRLLTAQPHLDNQPRANKRDAAVETGKLSKAAKRRQQRQAEEERLQSEVAGLCLAPQLAVRCLSYMFATQRLRAVLLADGVAARRSKKEQRSSVGLCGELEAVVEALAGVWDACRRLVDAEAGTDAAECAGEVKEFLCSGAELLMRVAVHVHAECGARAGREEDAGYETPISDWPDHYAQLMDTADACAAQLLASPPAAVEPNATRSKRSKTVAAVDVPQRLLLLAVQLTTDLLALDFASPSAVAAVSPAAHMHEWLSQLAAADPSAPRLSAVAPLLFKLFYHLTLATTSSTSASPSSQHYPWDEQLHHPLLEYGTYADIYRMLLSLLPSAGDTATRSVLDALQAFRAASHSERTLLNIALSTLPFVPAACAEAALALAVQLVTRSPACTAAAPALLCGVVEQSVGLGLAGAVAPLACALVRAVGEWVEVRVRDRARREVVWGGLLECVRGMKMRLETQEAEVMDEVKSLEHEVHARWKESGGKVVQHDSEDAVESDR